MVAGYKLKNKTNRSFDRTIGLVDKSSTENCQIICCSPSLDKTLLSEHAALKPIIGIPCRQFCTEYTDLPKAVAVLTTYIKSIVQAGGIPLPLPITKEYLESDTSQLEQLLSVCHGLLFTGGEDIHPQTYGEFNCFDYSKVSKIWKFDCLRDQIEIYLVKRAYEARMPIFGICRGMQLINVALGGSLHQHIPNHNHYIEGEPDSFWSRGHTINLKSDSLVAQALGCQIIKVNSMHHQSVKQIAPVLKAVGTSDDGIIEVIESAQPNKFILGFQSHPELLWQGYKEEVPDLRWLNVFKKFIQVSACRLISLNQLSSE